MLNKKQLEFLELLTDTKQKSNENKKEANDTSNDPDSEYNEFNDIDEEPYIEPEYKVKEPFKYYSAPLFGDD